MTRFRTPARAGAATLLAAALLIPLSVPAYAGTPRVTVEPFGTAPNGKAVHRYTLSNGQGVRVRILTFGGIVQSVDTPDAHGRKADVALGYKKVGDYVKDQKNQATYFGALIGRYANRIAKGTFKLDGKTYHIPINNNGNALHGGKVGFNLKVWKAHVLRAGRTVGVRLRYVSADGEQGFPGRLTATVDYTLGPGRHGADGALRIHYHATTTKPTVVNLTNHTYWNLRGEGTGTIYGHRLTIPAHRYTPVDATQIPTGKIAKVAGTPMDFTRPHRIGARIRDDNRQLQIGQGYDLNWVLDRHAPTGYGGLGEAAKVVEPHSGRVLTTYTTQPGVQFYSGNFLDGTEIGISGHAYRQGDGFALETQHFPDSPNHKNFPSTVLRPGQRYDQTTVYAFSTT